MRKHVRLGVVVLATAGGLLSATVAWGHSAFPFEQSRVAAYSPHSTPLEVIVDGLFGADATTRRRDATVACLRARGMSDAASGAMESLEPGPSVREVGPDFGFGISFAAEIAASWPATDSPKSSVLGAEREAGVAAAAHECEEAAWQGSLRGVSLEQFVLDVSAVEQSVASDPAVVRGWERWATCMRDAGFDYSDTSSIVKDLTSRMAAITRQQSAGSLHELQEYERSVAVQGSSCFEREVRQARTQVADKLEGAFLDLHPEYRQLAQ